MKPRFTLELTELNTSKLTTIIILGKKRQYEETEAADEENSQEEYGCIIEETSKTLDESFDSVEKHPNVRSYYNYFVGDQKQGWTLEVQNHWITKDGFNVSQILFQYRLESYRAAKMMLDLSDERVLSLSFIFLIKKKILMKAL